MTIMRLGLLIALGLLGRTMTGHAEPASDPAASMLTRKPAATTAQADKASMLAVANAGPRIVAVGDHGIVIISDDDGASFRQARSVPTRATLNAVNFVNDKEGWIAGHWGLILHTADGGESWTVQREDTSVDQPLFAVYFTDRQNGFAAGLWSLMLATHDGGQTWTPVNLAPPKGASKADKNLYQIVSNGRGVMLIAAEAGVIYRSTDGGQNWASVDSGSPGSFWAGLVLDDGSILLGGLSGALCRSTDAGQTWTRLASGIKSSITGLAQAPDGIIVAVGLDGYTLVSTDHGASFKPSRREDRLSLTAVTMNAKGHPIAMSDHGIARGG